MKFRLWIFRFLTDDKMMKTNNSSSNSSNNNKLKLDLTSNQVIGFNLLKNKFLQKKRLSDKIYKSNMKRNLDRNEEPH